MELLGAYVEIMLAANDLEAARTAAEELSTTAAKLDAAYLHATSARATGSILLAEGQARAALDALRQAYTLWQELEAPYETAGFGSSWERRANSWEIRTPRSCISTQQAQPSRSLERPPTSPGWRNSLARQPPMLPLV
jgi:hypothetical protein